MEKLEARFEFDTAEALHNAQRLLDAVGDLRRELDRTDDAMRGVGDESARTEKGLKKVGEAARVTGGQMRDGLERQAAPAAKSAAAATTTLDSVLKTAARSAVGMVTGFAGLAGVVRLLQMVKEHVEAVKKATDELTDKRLSFDQTLQILMRNLNLQGAVGEAQAKNMAFNFASQTTLTPTQSATMLSRNASRPVSCCTPARRSGTSAA